MAKQRSLTFWRCLGIPPNRRSPLTTGRPLTPDYSNYDLEQLRQVLRSIDADRFPERASEVRERIARLEQSPPEPESAPASLTERITLRNASKVLLAFAALDAVVAVANFLLHPGNTFSVNLAMLIGAALLWSGKLRAASLVRWLACAYLPVALYWAVLLTRQPLDLNLSYLRLYPLQVMVIVGLEACHWFVALWLVRTLGLPTILAARSAAGKKVRDMRIPFALGTLGTVAGIVLMIQLLGGERAIRAKSMAQQSVGKAYHTYVEGMNILTTTGNGESATFVKASVAAWNDDVVVHIPVQWRER
jgi:hypothetical protein